MGTWWKSPRLWLLVLLIAAVTVLLLRMGNTGVAVATVLAVPIAMIGIIVAAAAWLRPRPATTTDSVDSAVAALTRAQAEQWTKEETARRVQDPYPLPVRWQVSARAASVMASWASVRGIPGAGPVPIEGTYDQVVNVFAASDAPRRLVVLGEPGAGKSMLVLRLTLKLLKPLQDELQAGRTPTDPVPLLLSVARWHPDQPLDDWIAQRLATDYRTLARLVQAPDGSRRSLASQLLAAGRILPILDGLDEMTPANHAAALTGITNAPGGGRRFVLTSRTAPYETAVRTSGPLAGAAVIEIQPLSPAGVAQYLIDGTDQPQPRWNRVTGHLTGGADTPLVEALSTPLMAWLARAVYHHRGTDPSQLLTAGWAATRPGIEQHLLDQLVPAVYTTATGGLPARTPADADRARRWLTYLARHLHSRHTYDLAWWKLHQALPRPTLVVAGLVMGLVPWIVVGLEAYPQLGLAYFHVLALVAGTAGWYVLAGFLGPISPRTPLRASVRLRRFALISAGIVGGLLTAPLFVLVDGLVFWLGTVLVYVLVAPLMGALGRRAAEREAISPDSLLNEDRKVWLALALAFEVTLAPEFALFASVWISVNYEAGPAMGSVLFWVAVLWLVCGWAFVLVIGLTFSAWGTFCLTRALLAARGHTPLRLMTFLREAHDRGILRQAGGIYQFRHSSLQDHLADPHP